MKLLLISLGFLFLISSCSKKSSNDVQYCLAEMDDQKVRVSDYQSVPPPTLRPVDLKSVNKKKIIKDARIGIKVDQLQKSKKEVDSLLKNYEAYYSNESFENTDYDYAYNLTIRVPCPMFEPFMDALEKGSGELLYKEVTARDVTESFIDLEVRIANKKEYLVRYRQLLNKANEVKDILEIENEVRIIEEELDSSQGRLRYLSDQVEFSTVHLELEKQMDFNDSRGSSFINKFKYSITKGWYNVVDSVLFLIKLWPFILVLFGILYFYKKRKIKQKK